MSLTNDLFYSLLLTGIEGGIAYGFWLLTKKFLVRRKCYKHVYPLLWVVLFFFFVPVMFLYLRGGTIDWKYPEDYIGPIFMDTPLIYTLKIIMTGIWGIGVLFYFGNYWRDYRKYRRMIKQNTKALSYQECLQRIQKELRIKGTIQVYQNYAVSSPFVTGVFRKCIVLPVRGYDACELETIFYHELMHIRQRILPMKHLWMVAKCLYWWNPCMNSLLRSIDRWGETACDLSVCYESSYPHSKTTYFNVAVDALEESGLWLSGRITGFRKKGGLKERMICMKNYKRERELKRVGAAALCLVLCLTSTTTILAAGAEFKKQYLRLYEATDTNKTLAPEPLQVYHGTFDPEAENIVYDEDSLLLVSDGTEEITKKTISGNTTRYLASISAEKGDCVGIVINVSPSNKEVEYGLIKGSEKLYMKGSGKCSYMFTVEQSGTYRIYVKNTNSSSVTVDGAFVTY